MEARGDIERGSIAKLRKDAQAAMSHGQKSLKLLANALGPVVSLDTFMPKASPHDTVEMDALEMKPVLVFCCDEERKQLHCCTSEILLIFLNSDTVFFYRNLVFPGPCICNKRDLTNPSSLLQFNVRITAEGKMGSPSPLCIEASGIPQTRLSSPIHERC